MTTSDTAERVLRTDVLVVGAGPGGASAAIHLARLGRDALLVDGAEFPRDKACGDGLTPRAVAELQTLKLDHILEGAPVNNGLRGHGFGKSLVLPWNGPHLPKHGSAIARTVLDNSLRDAALDAGAVGLDGHRAVDVELTGGRLTAVVLRSSTGTTRVEANHVVVADGDGEGDGAAERAIHFQEWWVRHQASIPAQRFVVAGLDRATAAPGVLDAIRSADVVLLPPSNPVVSIGIILGVPGVRDALRGTTAPVVGISPLISGRPIRGHADACLSTIGIDSTAQAVAGLYEDFLDGWLVDPADATTRARARVEAFDGPLLMTDVEATARIAAHALCLADAVRA